MLTEQTAHQVIDAAAEAIQAGHDFHAALDAIPAAIYVTDAEGTITYYNEACIGLAGRIPRVGVDKWCVTWKIFTPEGEFLPHDQCPMAQAIRQGQPVRDVEAIAERPDGTRRHFIPYPTPLFGADGQLKGAVNLLLDVTEKRKPAYLQSQAARCRRLAADVTDPQIAATLLLMAAKYEEQAAKLSS